MVYKRVFKNERDYLKLIKQRIDRFEAGKSPLPKTAPKPTKRRNQLTFCIELLAALAWIECHCKGSKSSNGSVSSNEQLSFNAEMETPQERVARLKRELEAI